VSDICIFFGVLNFLSNSFRAQSKYPPKPKIALPKKKLVAKMTDLVGVDNAVNFLKKNLLRFTDETHYATLDEHIRPPRPTLMLFGREGSGKRTILREMGIANLFQKVLAFDLQQWTYSQFIEWATETATLLEGDVECSTLITINNLSELIAIKAGHVRSVLEDALTRLLICVRGRVFAHPVYVILLNNDSPGKLGRSIMQHIDYECYVPLPRAESRRVIFERFLDEARAYCVDQLPHISFDISEESLGTLVAASFHTTPREILRFIQLCVETCDKIDESEAIIGIELFEMLTNRKGTHLITDYDPLSLCESINGYLKIRGADQVEQTPLPNVNAVLDQPIDESVPRKDDGLSLPERLALMSKRVREETGLEEEEDLEPLEIKKRDRDDVKDEDATKKRKTK
jgi:hypothetical protein